MAIEREKQGLEIKDYQSILPNDTYALRIGKEVPEGDVNLAYVYTPEVNSDENISLVDTTYTSDNIIPPDQLESLVIANDQGELEYVSYIGEDEIQSRPPGNTFQSEKVFITKKFKNNHINTESALYYQIDILYHYDSQLDYPNDKGEYELHLYKGKQIEITDTQGNPLDDRYQYEIYVQAYKENPHIYSVHIYLHQNTDEIETFKVRYNHIDAVVSEEEVYSVANTIELYTNKNNTLSVAGKNMQLLESGKLRIINGENIFKRSSMDKVKEAKADEEIYTSIPFENGNGYKIVVPQRAEEDPRRTFDFTYQLTAEYINENNKRIKVTTGHISDWYMKPELLLRHEKMDYTGDWKNLGLMLNGSHLNSLEMLEMSLPINIPGIPSDAKLTIEDGNGKVLYDVKKLNGNSNIESRVNETMFKTPEAMAPLEDDEQEPWINGMEPNTVIRDIPIPHVFTVIPEYQETKWDFTWSLDGTGTIKASSMYQDSWRACADIESNDGIPSTICLPYKNVIFRELSEIKLDGLTIQDMLKLSIDEQLGENNYKVTRYYIEPVGEMLTRIDDNGFIYGRIDNPNLISKYDTPWDTASGGLSLEGTGTVEYHPEDYFTITTEPSIVTNENIPSYVDNFQWEQPVITSGSNITISLNAANQIQVEAKVPEIKKIGSPYTFGEQRILKTDEMKHMAYLFGSDGLFDKLNIPPGTPKENILLKIERGKLMDYDTKGQPIVENPEYRVNYRFRCIQNGNIRLPIDRYQNQLGENRIRLSDIVLPTGEVDPNIVTDIVAWTTYRNIEIVPLFSLKIEDEKKIQIEKPRVEQKHIRESGWYMRVKNGKFLKRIQLPYYNEGEKVPEIYAAYPDLKLLNSTPDDPVEVDLEYNLLDYEKQKFIAKPVMIVDHEEPIIINEFSIQTRYTPIVLQSEMGNSYLEVYSLRNNRKRELKVSDVDAKKGIIYLHDRIREQDDVYIRYAYEENYYTYRGFETRKTENGEEIREQFHLDLNPTPGHFHTIATNGFHRRIPIDNISNDYEAVDVSNRELLVKTIHLYIRPSLIRFADPSDPISYGKPIEGTQRTRTIYHTDEAFWFDPTSYRYDQTMFRLGKVMVQANSHIDQHMTILDTRTRGGGLDEQLSKAVIKQVNRESLYHWDIGYFDGEAYQENGVIVVRLPKSILKSENNPNGFHESEVQAAVAKHKGYGILPIIEYYDKDNTQIGKNLLPNYNFTNGAHPDYYNAELSKGDYDIIRSTSSESKYYLQITNDAEYGMTMPGYLFTNNRYTIDIKAMLENFADSRSAGEVKIYYRDGTSQTIALPLINESQWINYTAEIDMKDEKVHHLDIILNKAKERRNERVLFDYVTIYENPILREDDIEVHEI